MRLSQIIFEAWMKRHCQKHSLIDSHWGYIFQSLVEKDDAVFSTVIDAAGKQMVIKSKYVIGCDGAGSRVRASAGLGSKRHSLLDIWSPLLIF
jgi:FAD-dependent monooxygenase